MNPTHLREALVPALLRDEGVKLKPYRCSRGKLTIGVGRNLDDVGITHDEAMVFLENDIDAAIADCQRVFAWFNVLDDVRAGVLVQMRFQLGLARLFGFRKFLKALALGDHETAAVEMLDSKWATEDSPGRALRLATAMRTGRWI